MPLAVLPTGRTTFVKKSLEVSVAVPGPQERESVERMICQALAGDQRQLFVRVQGGGGFGPWCFWIQWGHGADSCSTAPVMLGEFEHTPQAILARIQSELAKLAPKAEHVH